MLTNLLLKLKHTCPHIWRGIEGANTMLTGLRYPHLRAIAAEEITRHPHPDGTRWSIVTPADAQALSAFLTTLPPERIKWFNPHPFDPATLRRMAASSSFVMIKVCHDGRIIGYHFLRCFFIGKAFHGLIVADSMAGHGIGTHMWHLGAAICRRAGIVMEATIHRDNTASLTSCRRGCNATVIATLPDGYLHLSTSPKDTKVSEGQKLSRSAFAERNKSLYNSTGKL